MKFIKFKMSFATVFVTTVFVGLLMSPLFIFGQSPASKLAVTPAGYDDMGEVLEKLGYNAAEISMSDLDSLSALSQYDAVYINCSGSASYIEDKAAAVVKSYVQNGGTLYASDWASAVIEKAFPEKVKFYNEGTDSGSNPTYPSQVGNIGEQTAKVVDSGLQAILGKKEVKVNFDAGSWVVIDSAGSGTKVHIQGPASISDYNSTEGTKTLQDKPYVVSFTEGNGQVLYTSFHNEAQNTEDMEKILNWFGIKTKAGKLAQATNTLLEKDGNKVLQEVVDGINQDESKSYNFKATGQADFSAALNFGGSAIEMTVTGPDGKKVTSKKVSTPPYTYEVKGAKEGTYSISVKGTEIPEKNYPFVLAFAGPENAMASTGDNVPGAPLPKTKNYSFNITLGTVPVLIIIVALAGGVTTLIILHKRKKKKKAAAEKVPVKTTPKESPNKENPEKTEESK